MITPSVVLVTTLPFLLHCTGPSLLVPVHVRVTIEPKLEFVRETLGAMYKCVCVCVCMSVSECECVCECVHECE